MSAFTDRIGVIRAVVLATVVIGFLAASIARLLDTAADGSATAVENPGTSHDDEGGGGAEWTDSEFAHSFRSNQPTVECRVAVSAYAAFTDDRSGARDGWDTLVNVVEVESGHARFADARRAV